MKIINGKKIASNLNEELKNRLKGFKKNKNIVPTLVVILIGNNLASKIYVKNKQIKADEVGIKSTVKMLSAETTEKELLDLYGLQELMQVRGSLVFHIQNSYPLYLRRILNLIERSYQK